MQLYPHNFLAYLNYVDVGYSDLILSIVIVYKQFLRLSLLINICGYIIMEP